MSSTLCSGIMRRESNICSLVQAPFINRYYGKAHKVLWWIAKDQLVWRDGRQLCLSTSAITRELAEKSSCYKQYIAHNMEGLKSRCPQKCKPGVLTYWEIERKYRREGSNLDLYLTGCYLSLSILNLLQFFMLQLLVAFWFPLSVWYSLFPCQVARTGWLWGGDV